MRAGLLLLGLVGCARDPVEAVCPDLVAGDLVITEVRGVQSPADLDGPWIELFNGTGATVDLEATKVRFRDRGGTDEISILVRRSVLVGSGEYVVLGLFLDGDPERPLPAHIDYGFLDDYGSETTWKDAAAVDLQTCGDIVDSLTWDDLPTVGTYSLGGTPDAEANNLSSSWCFDATSAGTPGAPNIPCP